MGNKGYTLCAVAPGPAYNQMTADVFTAGSDNGLPDGYTAFCPLAGQTSVAAYASATGQADVYAVPAAGQGFAAPAGSQQLTAGFDVLQPFTLGDQPMAVGYAAATGTFQFYSVSGGTFQALSTFSGTSPTTTGFTTVFTFLDWDEGKPVGTYLLGYEMDTGKVAIYHLSAGTGTAGSLDVSMVWQPAKPWAEGWTRFGVFQFGPENFFIKTNINYGKVFIDHIMDDPGEGTHPAVTDLPLPQDLTAVATFTLLADPCLATYLASSGEITLNRFQGSLAGWYPGAQATGVTGASQAVSLTGGAAPTLLFY
jgi:hypothetical protein